ncbi:MULTISPECIES: hypothetical protein [Acinetobacter]|jgi:hypothetical protein|uniref:Uncharacterized protein n=3 Tax=Acinetobacter calcoaceticus/baumannii complex TaxID=909768 RepID=A0A6L8M4I8_ACIBA|nr:MULTISPECIES: hypothetical protein [Acinetobacter]SSW84778.1 Uncharacterised protein [Klebsiella pneumoniae]ATI37541.1 hypothetical protein BS103_02590 [Acinetobacter baumannii]EHU2649112.1 hypothetical protein [Acinetobacter baumannii]EHU2652537.1 hypothetical protein [Acinetobacter baumannii]EIB6889980.1 hypothetical protein [Acinetobacter baumannii]
MESKITSDLALLEQNIVENFCYYYQCDLVAEFGNPLYAAMKEKIMLRMKDNDFSLSEQALSLIEASGDLKSIPFKPTQIFELLTQINSLRQGMDQLKKTLQKNHYSNILMAYVDALGGELYLIYNSTLERQAKAVRAAMASHTKNLYPRREIILSVLREQLAQRGHKWDSLNQAVTSIIPILIKEFEKYDLIWIKSQMNLMQAELQKLEQEDTLKSEPLLDNSIKRKKVTSAVRAKKIDKIQTEIKKLDSILHSKNPSFMLKHLNYKIPYNNTVYLDETIIHWLREQPEILKEILNPI